MATELHNHSCVSTSQVRLDLASALSIAGSAIDRAVVETLRGVGFDGIRAGHGYVFQRLIEGPSTVGEIADALTVTQQAVSKTVRELITLGYVEQAEDDRDRRRRPIALTARGRSLIEASRAARADFEGRVAAAVGARRLATALAVVAEAIDQLDVAAAVQARAVPATPDQLG